MSASERYYELCEDADMLAHLHPVDPRVLVERLRDRGGRPDIDPADVHEIVAAFALTPAGGGRSLGTLTVRSDGELSWEEATR